MIFLFGFLFAFLLFCGVGFFCFAGWLVGFVVLGFFFLVANFYFPFPSLGMVGLYDPHILK